MRAVKPVFSALGLLIFMAAPAGSGQGRVAGSDSPAAALPFSVGERLVFAVKWDPPRYFFFLPAMEAGEAELWMAEEIDINGKRAIKIVFKARSSGILASLAGMKIDDEFVFLAETETFCALSVSKKIREGKRKRQIDIEYLRETSRLRIRDMDESVTPPILRKDAVVDGIPACVQDPFSAVYLLRMSPLRAQYARAFPIGNDDKVKEVRALVEKQETVYTPAGKFSAWRINTIALMGGLFREGGQFRLWLSADERKIPVQFEAKVSLGRALGKLKAIADSPN